MRRPPPREQPPGKRFRRDLPRPEGPFDRLLRRRSERDPAPIIIGGTIAFLAIVILLVVGVSTLLGGGSDGGASSSSGGDGGELDFGGISGRITSRIPALAPGLDQVSDYIEFDLEDDLPPVRGFALPLRETTEDPAGLGFYTFDESRWRRLAEVKVVRGGRAESEFTEVPANLVVLRVSAQPYQVAGSLPPGGTLHPEAQITIISPRDYTPAQDGTVQGTATSPPEGEALVIPTIVGSGTDTANVVNDILADEQRRDAHIQAIVSLVNDSGLDGIDLEYSSVDVDLEPEFTEFVRTLADRLGDKRLSLTLPPPSDQQRQAYDWKAIGEAVDMIKILPIADPVSYWETMPRAISQIVEEVDPRKVLLVVSPYSIEGVGDVTRPIGYLQAMVIAAEAAVREPVNPDDIKPGTTVKLVARNLDQAEGGSPLRWDEAAAAVRFDLGGTERRRIVIENVFSVGFKLEIVQAYRLGGLAVSDASGQSDVANVWPVINELLRSATVSLLRPNETALLPVWQAPDGGDFGAGAGTTATWVAPKEGPHNVVLVVSDGGLRFGRKTLIEVKKAVEPSPTPLITFAPPTASPTPTPLPGASATPTPNPTLPIQIGVRVDADGNGTAGNDETAAPGSRVTYWVIIDNDSSVKVNVTSLLDSVWGNITSCRTEGGSASVVGIVLDEDTDHDGSEVDPDGLDAVSCRYEVTAPATSGTEVKNVVTTTVQAADGQTGFDLDDNTKFTTKS
ncbi:MAG TPA: glycosyl hydrolase family 18 protein [Dehalococcoidia bacterium]|nr:glycosyl hydrolase family 18 protein [Dehalococcoidia bacterium]